MECISFLWFLRVKWTAYNAYDNISNGAKKESPPHPSYNSGVTVSIPLIERREKSKPS